VQDGLTALFAAAAGGHDRVVERLVAAKAEINAATQVRDEARADTTKLLPALRPAAAGVAAAAGTDAGVDDTPCALPAESLDRRRRA
jgi:hypothetical protein